MRFVCGSIVENPAHTVFRSAAREAGYPVNPNLPTMDSPRGSILLICPLNESRTHTNPAPATMARDSSGEVFGVRPKGIVLARFVAGSILTTPVGAAATPTLGCVAGGFADPDRSRTMATIPTTTMAAAAPAARIRHRGPPPTGAGAAPRASPRSRAKSPAVG